VEDEVGLEVVYPWPESGVAGRHLYDEETGKHTVKVPPHASTRTKLHEFGHAFHGHTPNDFLKVRDLIDWELDAEIFSYEAMDKKPTWRVAINLVYNLSSEGIKDVNWIFTFVTRKLEEKGIHLSKKDRADFWWFLREKVLD